MESYTFHVSIPNTGRVWRKIELTAEQTLEDLHFAIQDAFDFDADHLYSFFMSGRAWDISTEYTLPEGVDPWDEDLADLDDEVLDEEEFDDELADEEPGGAELGAETPDEPFDLTEEEDVLGPAAYQAMLAALGDGPAPASFDAMLGMVKDNDPLRAELVKLMVAQTGVPPAMAELIFRNADKLNTLSPDQFAEQVLTSAPGELQRELLESLFFDDTPAGDVRTTTLAELDLAKGQKFLYLFDYGDEWRFNVRVHAVNPNADPAVAYPRLVEEVGVAPQQYPDYEDDEDWEDEDEAS